MGVPREDYNEDIHAFCGKCGVINLIESMEAPIYGDGLYCEICSDEIIYRELTALEFGAYRLSGSKLIDFWKQIHNERFNGIA
jgi:hypothetical protein